MSVYAPQLKLKAAAELELRKRQSGSAAASDWRSYARTLFGADADFADRHVRAWEWFAALKSGVAPAPLIECWGRGGGKSSTIEGGVAWLGTQPVKQRHFVLYVSRTQTQANAHVQAIGSALERAGIGRDVNRYNQSRGWTQQLLRARDNFNVLAFGLDAAMRGIKIDLFRPDLIVLDDIDDKNDSADVTAKKITTITETVLPSGSADVGIVFVQNKIIPDGVMAQLIDGRADFLHDRPSIIVEPAVIGLAVDRVLQDGSARYVVTGGTPTWSGQSLATVEQQINTWGLLAFRREAQHETDALEGGLWDRLRDIDPFRVSSLPSLYHIVVAIDPNASSRGDAAGIIIGGVGIGAYNAGVPIPHAYILADRTTGGGPRVWAEAAVAAYHAFRADGMIAEKNNGGDMVAITISTVPGAPSVTLIHASRGKITRAEPVQKLYADGRVHHVGTFAELEREQVTWRPGMPSPNRMDALVWLVTELLINSGNGWRAEETQGLQRRAGGR